MADNLRTLAELVTLNDLNAADLGATDVFNDTPVLAALHAVEANAGTNHKYLKESGAPVDSFRAVNAAQQRRDTLEKQADAYANRVLAAARGEAAAMVEEAEAYRAQAVNDAQGESARFNSVYAEYAKAPEVTRKRMYLETMEKVLGNIDKVIIDPSAGEGVVPYLPLDQLRRQGTAALEAEPASSDAATATDATTGGSN